MTRVFPPPDPNRCPVCDMSVNSPRCETCGADLSGPAGRELWSVDTDLYRLSHRRQQLVALVGSTSSIAAPPSVGDAAPSTPTPHGPTLPAAPPGFRQEPGPQVSSILLGLGVMLLVVAALVFAAVSWSRLGAAAQGALLIGLTLAAGFGTRAAKRRDLGGTAEALGILTVVMAPLVAQAVRVTLDLPDIGDRTWSNFGVWSWWPATMVVIGMVAMAFGRAVGVRGPRIVGVVLAQLGPVLWIALSPIPLAAKGAALALQAGISATGPAVLEDDQTTAALWISGSAVVWSGALLTALNEAFVIGDGVADRFNATAALAACALAAVAAVWRAPNRPYWSDLATAGAAIATVLACGRGLAGSVPQIAWWPVMGLVGAAGIVLADRARQIRSVPVLTVGWMTAGFAAMPLAADVIAVLAAASDPEAPWRMSAGSHVDVESLTGFEPAWVSALCGVVALGAAIAASHRRLTNEQFRVASAGLLGLGTVAVPALAGAPLSIVIATTFATALALAVVAPFVHLRTTSGLAVASLVLGVAWSLDSTSLMLVAGAAALAVGIVGALRGVENNDSTVAAAGVAIASLAIVAEAGLAATAFGADPGWAWAVAASTAAVLLAAAPVPALEGWPRAFMGTAHEPDRTAMSPDPMRRATWAGGALLLLTHAYAMVAITADTGTSMVSALTTALAIGAVALATVAVRTQHVVRGWWIWAISAGLEAVALVWLRLADADVTVWEAYSLPLAALIGTAGWLAARSRVGSLEGASSWHLEGPALAMALGPTVLLALDDPGITRLLIGLGCGAVLLAIGADQRRRAPFDIGTAAMVILGLHTLLPYAAEVPRWVSLGTVGAILIMLGATFEQRRQDFRQVKGHYSALV